MTMTRRDPTILFALLVALGVHLALIGVGVKVARRDLGWWLQSPLADAESARRPTADRTRAGPGRSQHDRHID